MLYLACPLYKYASIDKLYLFSAEDLHIIILILRKWKIYNITTLCGNLSIITARMCNNERRLTRSGF